MKKINNIIQMITKTTIKIFHQIKAVSLLNFNKNNRKILQSKKK